MKNLLEYIDKNELIKLSSSNNISIFELMKELEPCSYLDPDRSITPNIIEASVLRNKVSGKHGGAMRKVTVAPLGYVRIEDLAKTLNRQVKSVRHLARHHNLNYKNGIIKNDIAELVILEYEKRYHVTYPRGLFNKE